MRTLNRFYIGLIILFLSLLLTSCKNDITLNPSSFYLREYMSEVEEEYIKSSYKDYYNVADDDTIIILSYYGKYNDSYVLFMTTMHSYYLTVMMEEIVAGYLLYIIHQTE